MFIHLIDQQRQCGTDRFQLRITLPRSKLPLLLNRSEYEEKSQSQEQEEEKLWFKNEMKSFEKENKEGGEGMKERKEAQTEVVTAMTAVTAALESPRWPGIQFSWPSGT